MATSDINTVEATISAPISDNDDNPHTTMTLPTSDDGAQYRASGDALVTMMLMQEHKEEEEEENMPQEDKKGREDQKKSLPFMRMPKLKREKSYTETLERKQKRVKFSPNEGDDDVIVATHVFEPQVAAYTREPDHHEDNDDGAISSTLKKLLRKRSKKRKATIETQTDDKKAGEKVSEDKQSYKMRKSEEETREKELKVPVNRKTEPLVPAPLEATDQHEGNTDGTGHIRTVTLLNSSATKCLSAAVVHQFVRSEKSSSELVTGGHVDGASCDIRVEGVGPPVPNPAMKESEDDETDCDENERCLRILESQFDLTVPDIINDHELHQCCQNSSYSQESQNVRYEYDKDSPCQAAPLSEEQELEICEYSINVGDQQDISISSWHESSVPEALPDIPSATSPQENPPDAPSATNPLMATVKREGTFTLDGPPPAKVIKSSQDAVTYEPAPAGRILPITSNKEPLHFFIDLDVPEITAAEMSSVVTLAAENGNDNDYILDTIQIHHNPEQLKSSRTNNATKMNQDQCNVVPKSKNQATKNKIKGAVSKRQDQNNSTVITLRNNAKRTLVNAWKTAMKTQDGQDKPVKSALKSPGQTSTPRSSPTKPLQQQEDITKINSLQKRSDPKTVTWAKYPAPPKREPLKTSRELGRGIPRQDSPRTPPERSSVWAGVSLPTFRREGTFTKKYDAERDRLQGECNRLGVERDR